jgi:hypothetical protein
MYQSNEPFREGKQTVTVLFLDVFNNSHKINIEVDCVCEDNWKGIDPSEDLAFTLNFFKGEESGMLCVNLFQCNPFYKKDGKFNNDGWVELEPSTFFYKKIPRNSVYLSTKYQCSLMGTQDDLIFEEVSINTVSFDSGKTEKVGWQTPAFSI